MSSSFQNRGIDILKAEQDAGAAETRNAAELARLESVAGEVLGRLQHARAAASQLQAQGADVGTVHSRVSSTQVPALDVATPAGDALMARWAAVEARNRANEQVRQLVHSYAAELSRLTSQLNADEQELRAAEQQVRARLQEAERERKRAEEAARAVPVAAVAATPAFAMPPPPPPSELRPPPPPKSPPRPQGRREQGRVRMQAAITISSESNFFTGFSTNISEGGLFIATASLLPLGSPIEVQFTLPGSRPIQVQGVVRWRREVNDNTPEIFPGIGIQFNDLSPEAEGAIRQFVQSREPLFFPD